MDEKLREQIEQNRSEMIRLATEKGMTHPETIKSSQKLDKLINKAHKAQGK